MSPPLFSSYSKIMPRFFNTTGPCNPEKHYMLPPEVRLVRAQLDRYIGDELYWVLHAPRQSGKTTFLQSWMRKINGSGEAVACYVSVERCQQFPEAAQAMPMICEAIVAGARRFLKSEMVPRIPRSAPEACSTSCSRTGRCWCRPNPW